jgi:putative hydrolase of the HAD superfamily
MKRLTHEPEADQAIADAVLPSGRLLLLDVGGVVLADPLAPLFDRLAGAGRASRAAIADFYQRRLRQGLWAGTDPEPAFWTRLTDYAGVTDDHEALRAFTISTMSPLIPLEQLRRWARRVPIWLLSNHREEWLGPALANLGIDSVFARRYVSSLTGLVKPDPAAFRAVVEAAPFDAASILYVDDKVANVRAAETLGMIGLVAASDDWPTFVDVWVAGLISS